ncbi:hypothetical protein Dvina_47120 [Dactylosporangium vinaceum]|uniref:MarR family transcriptional regulator n=1 Tax=Dactylosporangium vinaceum TaxID=53362 RepID=A0ABV5M5C1_9ACTN|nr:hypothetical protein [Dactylosporangium vinaceum]UAB95510.1 hypothetical protein Dvina_47120 [Dactylosporangium vinaceum]
MDRPIGYWLRELDKRLEAAFAATLAGHGVERRDWQVLNGLGPDDPFWGPGERTYTEVVAALTARGWTSADGTVTPAGATARAEIAAAVDGIRRTAAAGVSDESYLTTVRTLSTMVTNLAAHA